MPHIELKTSANLAQAVNIPDLLEHLATKLASFDTIRSSGIKAYHVPVGTWVMGEGAPRGFAQCTASLIKGRPLELRQRIAEGMFEVLREAFAEEIEHKDASVTFELREMDADTYQR